MRGKGRAGASGSRKRDRGEESVSGAGEREREPVRPGAVSPDRALCLPTFSHFLIVKSIKLLSLSLSLPTPGLASFRNLSRP
jgi:hypothetical protein